MFNIVLPNNYNDVMMKSSKNIKINPLLGKLKRIFTTPPSFGWVYLLKVIVYTIVD